MNTTDSKFWGKMGFEKEEATALAENVSNFIYDALGEDELRFDYSADLAADYVPAYEIWAASEGIIKRSTGF